MDTSWRLHNKEYWTTLANPTPQAMDQTRPSEGQDAETNVRVLGNGACHFVTLFSDCKKKRTSIQQTEQTEAKQSITDRVCLASGLYLWKIDHKNYSEFVTRQVRDGKSHKLIKSTRQHRLKGTGRSKPTLSDDRIHLIFGFIWRGFKIWWRRDWKRLQPLGQHIS